MDHAPASIPLAGRNTTTDSVPNTLALDLLPASGTLSILVASRSQRLSHQAITIVRRINKLTRPRTGPRKIELTDGQNYRHFFGLDIKCPLSRPDTTAVFPSVCELKSRTRNSMTCCTTLPPTTTLPHQMHGWLVCRCGTSIVPVVEIEPSVSSRES